MVNLQLKSQVRCLECGYVSVRFDPFTFLSLPLPMDNSIYVEVIGKFANNLPIGCHRCCSTSRYDPVRPLTSVLPSLQGKVMGNNKM